MAGADEQARVVAVDHDEGEVALEVADGAAHGRGQVAVVVLLDQVGDGLGVGLGAEDVAVCLQALAQLAVVLDDPVEDDRELVAVAAGQGVRVRLGDAAVGGPARVAEAGRRARAVRAGGRLQVLDAADGADVVEAGRPRRSAIPAES